MESLPDLTEAAVPCLARPQSFERGENYYEKGAVFERLRSCQTADCCLCEIWKRLHRCSFESLHGAR